MIKIDRYEAVIEHGQIEYYAVKGKTRYHMPSAYADMYNDKYLSIEERTLEMPELFGTTEKHYIPLRTDNVV